MVLVFKSSISYVLLIREFFKGDICYVYLFSLMLEIVWIFSTGLGTLLFLAKIAILCWVKFYNHTAAVAASVVLVPVCIVLVWFVVHFNRSLVQHKYEISFQRIKELQ